MKGNIITIVIVVSTWFFGFAGAAMRARSHGGKTWTRGNVIIGFIAAILGQYLLRCIFK